MKNASECEPHRMPIFFTKRITNTITIEWTDVDKKKTQSLSNKNYTVISNNVYIDI